MLWVINHKMSLRMSLVAWGRVDCNNNLLKIIILPHFAQKVNIGCLVEIIPLNFRIRIVYSLSIPWRLILTCWQSLLCSLAHAQKILESKWINMFLEGSPLSMLSCYSLHVVPTSSMGEEVCLPGILLAIPCTVLCNCHHCRAM